MHWAILVGVVAGLAGPATAASPAGEPRQAEAGCPPLLARSFPGLMDDAVSLCQFKGKVVLIVNTASQCGFTPQYEGLESLGEVTAAIPLVKEIKQKFSEAPIVLSTSTATGNHTAKQYLHLIDHLIFFPYDYPFIVRRFIGRIRARVFISLETELWPNFLRELGHQGIPAIMVSGRISPRSFRNYRAFRFLFKNVLKDITCFCMQSSADAERIIALGADRGRVQVTGNIKFDLPIPDLSGARQDELYQSPNLQQGQKLFIAGSTHPGEEEIVLEVFQKLHKDLPDLVLLIAPRHPERFNEVEALIRARGMCFCRKTALTSPAGAELVEVILLDTIGELANVRMLPRTFQGI